MVNLFIFALKCNSVAKVYQNMIETKKNNSFLILEIISNANGALSHAEIQESLENKCNRVTVYRILDKLIEKGDIHKMIDTDGVSKFALCTSCQTHNHSHEHIHFSCTKCLVVSCLEEADLSFKLPKSYQVLTTNFTISGICPKCS